MRSPDDDRTARAVIRDEALRLFAERGADAVSLRQIAAAAGVSAALIVRHYGSRDGLRAAVDEHVVRMFEAMLTSVVTGRGADPFDPRAVPSLAGRLAGHLPEDSPIPGYVARMLVDGGAAGAELFARLHALAMRVATGLVASGAATDGGDLPARAAWLLANDLAVIVLRDRLQGVLGVDPLSVDGLLRWGRQTFAIYQGGLAAPTADR